MATFWEKVANLPLFVKQAKTLINNKTEVSETNYVFFWLTQAKNLGFKFLFLLHDLLKIGHFLGRNAKFWKWYHGQVYATIPPMNYLSFLHLFYFNEIFYIYPTWFYSPILPLDLIGVSVGWPKPHYLILSNKTARLILYWVCGRKFDTRQPRSSNIVELLGCWTTVPHRLTPLPLLYSY